MLRVATVVLVALLLTVAVHADLSLGTAPTDWVTVPAAATQGDDTASLLFARVGDPLDGEQSDDYFLLGLGVKDAEIFAGGDVKNMNLDDLTFGIKYQVEKVGTPLSIFLYNIGEGQTAVPGFAFDPKIKGLPVVASVAGWYNDGWEAGAAMGYKVLPYTLAAVEYNTSDKFSYGLQMQAKVLNASVMWLDKDNDWLISLGGTVGF